MGNAAEVTVLQAISDHAFDRCGNRTPRTTKQLRNRAPGQHLGPFGQKTTIGTGHALFAGRPGKLHGANPSTCGTEHPARFVFEPERHIPQGNVAKQAGITHIPVDGRTATCSAAYPAPGIRANFSDQTVCVFSD